MITARQFGSSLRRQREGQNISLKTVEARTKISASLLAGLEKGDCSRWPAGIYSRSWVRAYAQVIGLDPETTLAQFAACFAETAFPDAPAREASGEAQALRLGLEPEPAWRLRAVLGRAALLCADGALILALALTGWLTGAVTLVNALAAAAALIHAIGILSGCGSTSGAIQHVIRTTREAAAARERERARESTLIEVA